MKLFIAIFVTVIIAAALCAQTGSRPSSREFQKMTKEAANFVNTFSGTEDQFQAAICVQYSKAPKNLTPAQINQFNNAVCELIKPSSDYQCDDFKAAVANC
jgi:hypothetical protein